MRQGGGRGGVSDSRAEFGLFVCKLAIDGTFYLTGLLQYLEGETVGLQAAMDEKLGPRTVVPALFKDFLKLGEREMEPSTGQPFLHTLSNSSVVRVTSGKYWRCASTSMSLTSASRACTVYDYVNMATRCIASLFV